jgi:hypothetical protein
MITTKCLIRFNTHTAHIQVDSRGYIQVFKYGSRTCDFDVFSHDDQYEASDYILVPPNETYYYVTFPGEPPPHHQS